MDILGFVRSLLARTIAGDFDTSVDFEVGDGWDAPQYGVTLGLVADFGGPQRSKFDTSGPGYYLNHFTPRSVSDIVASVDRSGSLRMRRIGRTVETFRRDGDGNWVVLGTTTLTTSSPTYLHLSGWRTTSDDPGPSFALSFDNFVVYFADAINCPVG